MKANCENYHNAATGITYLHGITPTGAPFVLTVNDENRIGLEWKPVSSPAGQIGSVSTALRVKCWGLVFYKLTRGVEIPKCWFAHNEYTEKELSDSLAFN